MLLRAFLSAIVASLLMGPAMAQYNEPCGGFLLSAGTVQLTQPLNVHSALSDSGKACLQAIGASLQQRENLQTVTIAARVPNLKVMMEKGNEVAQGVADLLADSGIPRALISTVVPLTRPGEAEGIYISYVARTDARRVAQIQTTSGRVFAGPILGQLEPARAGQLLAGSDYVETGTGSQALIKLLDESLLHILEDSALRVGEISVKPNGRREVHIQMLRGEAIVTASKLKGPFFILTGNAVAGVRGTHFRIANPKPKESRVETLTGLVTFGSVSSNIFVPAGKGTRVTHQGIPEEPRALLTEPQLHGPLVGEAIPGQLATWAPVPSAYRYRVEFATDAQFTDQWQVFETREARLLIPDSLTPGKWFWRVTAQDNDGFHGYSSKIYAFTIP